MSPASMPGMFFNTLSRCSPQNLASGVYLVRLEAEGVVHATQKVLLLR